MSAFVHPDEIRSRFSAALSAMYRAEVPQYGALLTLVADINARVLEADSAASWRSSFIRMPYQRDAMVQRSVIAETFETACTWDAFEQFHAGVVAAAT